MKIENCIRCKEILYYDEDDCEETTYDYMAICYHDDSEYISYFYYKTSKVTNYIIRNPKYNIYCMSNIIKVKNPRDFFSTNPILVLDNYKHILNYDLLINKINIYLNFL